MKPIHRIGLIAIAGAALALSSCATGGRSPSGFLANFSQLDAGYGTTDAVSAYVKPGVDLKKYDSVMIDPVTTVVATPGNQPAGHRPTRRLSERFPALPGGRQNENRRRPGPTTSRCASR